MNDEDVKKMDDEDIEELEEEAKEVGEKAREEVQRTRSLSANLEKVIKIAAILMAIGEILFVFSFNFTLYNFFGNLGIELDFLRTTILSKQASAYVMGILFVIVFLRYPIMQKTKYKEGGIQLYDYILAGLGILATIYFFPAYSRYAVTAEIVKLDIVFALISVALVLEGTRRALNWILPVIDLVFLGFALVNMGFNWGTFAQQLYFDEGIFAIPFFVMVTYVFAFIFFGSFLLKIGISDYISEFMMVLFGGTAGGPAKAGVISSAFMGTISGSSVANTLTTGTFTIPLMKKSGYKSKIAGAVEPVASTGGQLMPPVMGAAAFVMAQLLGIPYRRIIIAAIIPALVYFAGVYFFVNRETEKLGLGGVKRSDFPELSYYLKKLYLLFPVVVIAITLVGGMAPQIAALASLGVAIWAAWISLENLDGHELFFAGVMIVSSLLLYFTPDEAGPMIGPIYFLIAIILAGMSITDNKLVETNEKLYVSLLFLILIGTSVWTGMTTGQTFLMTGVIGIVISIVLGFFAPSKAGRSMFTATYESIVDAAETSVSVMLAAAAAGLIQTSLTMTGMITKFGYRLVDLTGGRLPLLLLLAMVFCLILGMGVPTTANYIITSLVVAPAILLAVEGIPMYTAEIPGTTLPVAKMGAHIFVFYFGLLADVTPPVALAAYAGSAIAKSDFWETAKNACKYALAGYIGPYIYFTHPEMFLITVQEWTPSMILQIVYQFIGILIAMYLLAIALTGYYNIELKRRYNLLIIIAGLTVASLNYIAIAAGLAFVIALRYYTGKKADKKEPEERELESPDEIMGKE